MVNAHFKCRHISQFKELTDVINYWKWKEKERVKLGEEMLVQTGTPFDYWVIIGVVDFDLGLVYLDGKLRHRPKTFMKSPRLNSAVLEFKS